MLSRTYKASKKTEFVAGAYQRCIQGVRNDRFDMVLLVNSDTEGMVASKFALAHWTITAYVGDNSAIKGFESMAQFSGMHVGLFAGYEYPKSILEHASAWQSLLEIHYSETDDDQKGRVFRLLEFGRMDVALIDRFWAHSMIVKQKYRVRALEPAVYTERSVIGYSPRAQAVTQLFETALAEVASNGRLAKFYTAAGVAPPKFR